MNSLFKDTIKINCPDEVLKIITCYAKALRAHDKVGKLLHLFPSGKQIEGWEKEAKEHKNMKLLREKIYEFELLGTYQDSQIKRTLFPPHTGKDLRSPTRWMLEERYINEFIYQFYDSKFEELGKNMVYGKQYMRMNRSIPYKKYMTRETRESTRILVAKHIDEIMVTLNFIDIGGRIGPLTESFIQTICKGLEEEQTIMVKYPSTRTYFHNLDNTHPRSRYQILGGYYHSLHPILGRVRALLGVDDKIDFLRIQLDLNCNERPSRD